MAFPPASTWRLSKKPWVDLSIYLQVPSVGVLIAYKPTAVPSAFLVSFSFSVRQRFHELFTTWQHLET